jgi:hypothetical protein
MSRVGLDMSSQFEISDAELLGLADQLVPSYFIEPSFYALVLLAYVTVRTYSEQKRHLAPQTIREFVPLILPKLISRLAHQMVIDNETRDTLVALRRSRQNEIRPLVQTFATLIAARPPVPPADTHCGCCI